MNLIKDSERWFEYENYSIQRLFMGGFWVNIYDKNIYDKNDNFFPLFVDDKYGEHTFKTLKEVEDVLNKWLPQAEYYTKNWEKIVGFKKR